MTSHPRPVAVVRVARTDHPTTQGTSRRTL